MSSANRAQLVASLGTVDPEPPADPPAGPSPDAGRGRRGDVAQFVVAAAAPCSDASPGTAAAPLCTIPAAVQACRRVGPSGGCDVLLRAGVHRLSQTVTLTSADSHTRFASFAGEAATVSGAQVLGDTDGWTKVRALTTTQGDELTVWKTAVPASTPPIETMLVDGVRAIQARYPNADPEVDKFPLGYISGASTTWGAAAPMGEPKYIEYNATANFRPSYRSLFQDYRGGVGGQCAHYTPPFSYWCAETPQGGGAAQFTLPASISFDQAQALPHAPYKSGGVGALLTAWRQGHWANWQFAINSSSTETANGGAEAKTTLTFGKGGFQGGRGAKAGAEWFISNVFEELDFPREFYHDTQQAVLYYVSGSTTLDGTIRAAKPPTSSVFEHAQLKTLFELRGTQTAPVVGVAFTGLAFTAAAQTFMDPHGVPSGGDWALQRSAALFFEGTEHVALENSMLVRLDGNAVMLSGYNQRAKLVNNTFLSTGATAIALWGYTNGTDPAQPAGTGPDGTAGNFPRYTVVSGNFFRHLGIHEKQSSCLFQAKAAESMVTNNICFDVPRAGFNFNDGFGGGNNVSRNLLFQTCGESGDHGAINTWDRQSFITTVRTGSPSIVPAMNRMYQNFIVSDYDADGGMIDNDDGSSFYDEFNNFGVYGGAKFGNIDGHAKISHGNVYAFPNVYGKSCFWHWPGWFPLTPWEETFYNNTCVLQAGENYIKMPPTADFDNTSSIGLHVHSNTVLAPNAHASVEICGKGRNAGGSSISVTEWLKKVGDFDKGTMVGTLPSFEEIVAMGLAVTGIRI